MTITPGQELRGYKVMEVVGTGAFGAVYRAQQSVIGREVAIKIILPEYANRPDFIRSFEAEAQLVARLEHIHIVPLFDYWRDPEGAYLVMRLLPRSLREEIMAVQNKGLSFERIADILDQISSALMVAHRNGVVHRDLKPANILLDRDQNAYLADFGIAKVLTSEGEKGEEDSISGTPAYISPEQVMGSPVSARTDIYALGIILFEMLAGRKPFATDNMAELMVLQLNTPLPSVLDFRTDVPYEVDDIIQRATSKDPDDRYADAIQIAHEFRRAISSSEDAAEHTILFDSLQIANIANPYKGLRAFEQADSDDFYGREDLIDRLLARLNETFHPMLRFLAVVGASGSGKSSVIKAGVLPALRRGKLPNSQNWYIAEIVPNVHPLRELEAALLSIATTPVDNLRAILFKGERGLVEAVNSILPEGTELVLVIDQFEEAFTMVADEEERTLFLAMVRQAAVHPQSRLRIIVTMRADFLDHPLQYPGFGALMRERIEFVLPMSGEEIERALRGPAERVGLLVEPELVKAVVQDVEGEPGALPLLQYALTEVFERREGLMLTHKGYIESGGATGALARRAEQLFLTLDEKTQASVRQLFLRLVTLGEGQQDTRRRMGWSELALIIENAPEIIAVRDLYVKYRLLTTDRDPQTREPTLEIAHEALIRRWQRLLDWLNTSREDIRIQRRLAISANEWRAASRDKSFLQTGAQLEQIADWASKTDVLLTEEERAFIASSLVEKRSREAREKARQTLMIEQERTRTRRLQFAIFGMVGLVGLVLGFAIFNLSQSQKWEGQANTLQTTADALVLELEEANQQLEQFQPTMTTQP